MTKRRKAMRHARSTLMLSALLAAMPTAMAQQSTEVLPKVVQHSEPVYPPLARQTRIQGEVLVKVTTDGESVRYVQAETGACLAPQSCRGQCPNVEMRRS